MNIIIKSLILFTALILFFSCSKELNKNEVDNQKLSIDVKESANSSKHHSDKERDLFITNRIKSIQEDLDITTSQIITAETPACSEVSDNISYEVIPVISDNSTKGYLYIFEKDKNYESFYQEIKYNNDGVAQGFVIWSEKSQYVYSTNESMYKPKDPSMDYSASNNKAKEEDYLTCVARVFQQAKAACEADPKCNLLCYITGPTCEGCMLAAAAAACKIYK
ncbi:MULTISPECIES: hypothetical protein [Sphingobacterium]|uniref:hypothetical protein n=1 Tax=Sphingobacterium TaxID=28453 RepID=UPI000EC68EDB|nr:MULTISPECIES: hypothetical protein [Sphingobacterium]HAK27873.1 hypothetical protein [Sphingobacterium sp.]